MINYENFFKPLGKPYKLNITILPSDIDSYISHINDKFNINIVLNYNKFHNVFHFKYNTFEYYLDGFLLKELNWINIKKIISNLLIGYEYSKDIFIIRKTGGLWDQLQNANIMHYKTLTQKDFNNFIEKIFKTKY